MITDLRLPPIAAGDWAPKKPLFCKCCKREVGLTLESGQVGHRDEAHAEDCMDAQRDVVSLAWEVSA